MNTLKDTIPASLSLKDMFTVARNDFRHSRVTDKYFVPADLYFKPLFYFADNTGLLSSTFIEGKTPPTCAWSQLKLYAEDERAEYIKQFCLILSELSAYKPWSFSAITLPETITAPVVEQYDTDNKKITLKMTEGRDMMVTTMLDCYKKGCWDLLRGLELLPANMRRFNMGIVVFQNPARRIDTPGNIAERRIKQPGSAYYGSASEVAGGRDVRAEEWNRARHGRAYKPSDSNAPAYDGMVSSYKIYELFGCEIDISSVKPYNEIKNNEAEPSESVTFDIKYKYATEDVYNAFAGVQATDFTTSNTRPGVDTAGWFFAANYPKPEKPMKLSPPESRQPSSSASAERVGQKAKDFTTSNTRPGVDTAGCVYAANYPKPEKPMKLSPPESRRPSSSASAERVGQKAKDFGLGVVDGLKREYDITDPYVVKKHALKAATRLLGNVYNNSLYDLATSAGGAVLRDIL